jgi:nicotinamidase/pyrazinamidase
MQKEKKTAIIVVDIQSDFTIFKKGSLAVEGTDEEYIKEVEKATKNFKSLGISIFATQDWHPKNHISFFTNHPGKKPFEVIKLHGKDQILWPPHCVEETSGAEILIDKTLFRAIIKKGMDPQYDSYSGFQDDGGKKTELNNLLNKEGIKKIILYGIALDYCVKATAIDAISEGYQVALIPELCRGVSSESSQKAIEEMKSKGVIIFEKFESDIFSFIQT